MNLSCFRSASTTERISGYWSLQASALPDFDTARCTCPKEAAAAAVCSNDRNFISQSAPSSAAIRRLTKSHPIAGALFCNCASSSTYSGGNISGTVDIICATFINGPFNPPRATRKSRACLSLSKFEPRYLAVANLAASPPTAPLTRA